MAHSGTSALLPGFQYTTTVRRFQKSLIGEFMLGFTELAALNSIRASAELMTIEAELMTIEVDVINVGSASDSENPSGF